MRIRFFPLIVLFSFAFLSCESSKTAAASKNAGTAFSVGAGRTELYRDFLSGKRVGLLANQASLVEKDGGRIHTLDFLLENGIGVTAIFSPEHGFRGNAGAGDIVGNDVDSRTGIPIISLYNGGDRHPSKESLEKVDVIVCDLQDVGTRFYTYYITMMEMMESACDYGKVFVVFDRPNPNGAVIDGPVLKDELKSHVGRIPVPMSHGLTMGEIALMANAEGWLDADASGKKRSLAPGNLVVVPCRDYVHSMEYVLPKAPSPNLPNMHAVKLYPSLCLFEGTVFSLGRGTDFPFEIYGHPGFTNKSGYPDISFTPKPCAASKNPPLNGEKCFGADLRALEDEKIIAAGVDVSHVINAFASLRDSLSSPEDFFIRSGDRYFFDLLAGDVSVRRMIMEGRSAGEIKDSWASELEEYKALRKKYVIYED